MDFYDFINFQVFLLLPLVGYFLFFKKNGGRSIYSGRGKLCSNTCWVAHFTNLKNAVVCGFLLIFSGKSPKNKSGKMKVLRQLNPGGFPDIFYPVKFYLAKKVVQAAQEKSRIDRADLVKNDIEPEIGFTSQQVYFW